MRRSEASIATRVIWPTSGAPQAPFRRAQVPEQVTEHDNSITGVLIFCGIGLSLTVLAAIFQWLELPPPYF
jgi:hypothetical protein